MRCAAVWAVALAVAAGPSVAVPETSAANVEPTLEELGGETETVTVQQQEQLPQQQHRPLIETVNSQALPSQNQNQSSVPSPVVQWVSRVMKAAFKQLSLQQRLVTALLGDIQGYFTEMLGAIETSSAELSYVNALRTMLDRIRQRVATTAENMSVIRSKSGTFDAETLRTLTSRLIKEIRVQEVLLDALWASMRGTQTTAWLMGLTDNTEQVDIAAAANRAAEEFLTRMHSYLRAAGVSEEDIERFVPSVITYPIAGESMGARNMGRLGRFGFGSPYLYEDPFYGYSSPYTSFGTFSDPWLYRRLAPTCDSAVPGSCSPIAPSPAAAAMSLTDQFAEEMEVPFMAEAETEFDMEDFNEAPASAFRHLQAFDGMRGNYGGGPGGYGTAMGGVYGRGGGYGPGYGRGGYGPGYGNGGYGPGYGQGGYGGYGNHHHHHHDHGHGHGGYGGMHGGYGGRRY